MDISSLLERVRQNKPLVHHLTNWVTIYDCANIVKVFGASPVMAHSKDEVADMVKLASSLVINIGTLTKEFIEAAKIAGLSAKTKGIPIVLDVCGAGATPFRDEMAKEIIQEGLANIIKGNPSEIARVAGEKVQTKGVDSGFVDGDMIAIAKKLAAFRKAIVVITGKHDIVSDGKRTALIKNGNPIMSCVVGTGCMSASMIGAFAGVEKDLYYAACSALCCYEIAAEIAAATAKGPGTFKEALFDAAYHLDKKTVDSMQKVEEMLPA